MLPSMLDNALVSLPLTLLATTLVATGHAEHVSVAEMLVQAALIVFLAALLLNVILSVVAILRERHVLDPPETGASSFVAELEQRPARATPPGTTSPPTQSLGEHAPPRQIVSER
jgi:hypothetical protein